MELAAAAVRKVQKREEKIRKKKKIEETTTQPRIPWITKRMLTVQATQQNQTVTKQNVTAAKLHRVILYALLYLSYYNLHKIIELEFKHVNYPMCTFVEAKEA